MVKQEHNSNHDSLPETALDTNPIYLQYPHEPKQKPASLPKKKTPKSDIIMNLVCPKLS